MPKIGSIGIPELLIILVVVLLIFGPRRLPDMAKGLGQSVREFRKGLRDMRKEFDEETSDETSKPGAAQATTAGTVSAASMATPAAAQPQQSVAATAGQAETVAEAEQTGATVAGVSEFGQDSDTAKS